MSVKYSRTSPYADSNVYGFFLDVCKMRDIPRDPSDVTYKIDTTYSKRPDLLAFDLYGDANLWWVFSVRNPNTIKDPVFDFIAGVTIYIPKKETIVAALGL